MITRPTVLILGAGASWDYGFPLGYGLRQDIIKGLASNHGKPRLAAQEAGFHEEQINRFLLTFQNSQLYSIDLFLHRHAKLKELGKFIIAWFIQYYEQVSNFHEPRSDVTPWFREFFNRLMRDDYFEQRKTLLRILTFNYDRSLEEFMYRALLHSTPHDDPTYLVDLMKHIPVTHAYGSLGPLSWQQAEAQPYGYKGYSADHILKLSQNISIVHENPPVEDEWNTALKFLSKARLVAFLGFGFAKENIERLQVPEKLDPDAEVFATAVNVGRADKDKISELLRKNREPAVENIDCYRLLNDHPILG